MTRPRPGRWRVAEGPLPLRATGGRARAPDRAAGAVRPRPAASPRRAAGGLGVPHELIVAGVVPAAELAAATLALARRRDWLQPPDSPPGLPRSPHRARRGHRPAQPARRRRPAPHGCWIVAAGRRRAGGPRTGTLRRGPPLRKDRRLAGRRGPWWCPSAPGRTTGRRSGSALGLPAPRTPRCGLRWLGRRRRRGYAMQAGLLCRPLSLIVAHRGHRRRAAARAPRPPGESPHSPRSGPARGRPVGALARGGTRPCAGRARTGSMRRRRSSSAGGVQAAPAETRTPFGWSLTGRAR